MAGGGSVSTEDGDITDVTTPYTPANDTAQTISYSDVPLGPKAWHTYKVSMQFTTSPGATNLTCTDQPSNGLFNRVDISGSTTANANACSPGPGAPNVTITKTDPKLSGPVGASTRWRIR